MFGKKALLLTLPSPFSTGVESWFNFWNINRIIFNTVSSRPLYEIRCESRSMIRRTSMVKSFLPLIFFSICFVADAQTSASSNAFIDYQRGNPRVVEVMNRKEDTLMKQFAAKKLEWPAKYLYIRSFKYDSQLEVWVKNEKSQPFKLFKTYKVCALAGTLGPKRIEGDYQVPEGFYFINEFNPKSQYHFSLGLNYPNASDRLLSDSLQPGGDIYIHGSCVTTGCIPITDGQIEELYVLAAYAKSMGEDFIPVHIYPIRFENKKSSTYLEKYLKDFSEYGTMANDLRNVYYYFEKTHQLPVIMINQKGEYLVDEDVREIAKTAMAGKSVGKIVVKKKREHTMIDESEIPNSVNKLPQYPGGNDAFQEFLKKTSADMVQYLNEDQRVAYVQVEFTIDKEGNPINPRIVKGGNDDLNEHLLDAFEAMPKWAPAIRLEKPVPMKLKQTIVVEAEKT